MTYYPKLNPADTIHADIPRPTPDLIARASKLPTATLHEAAGRIGALPSVLRPVSPHFKICGAAVTVDSPGGDNLWIHRALYVAQPGDILVVNVSGEYEYGYWGEIMATAAQARKLGGLVINGGVRDSDLLCEMGFPVFSRGLAIRGTGKDFAARGWIGAPMIMGDVTIKAGDLIAGDNDGVVVIPRERVEEVIDKSIKREIMEEDVMKRLKSGESSLSIYGWE